MERNSTKRKPNFTEGENLFLIDQYKHHKAVLSSKLNSSAMLNNEKYQIWQKICTALNERNPHTVRTVEEVRKRWKNMVCNAKKEALLFKRSQTERGGKGTKTHSKLSTVTKRIIELKEDFATLHDSSGACAAETLISSSDSPVEVVIPNGQCVVIKTEDTDDDEGESSLQSEHHESQPSSSATISHQTVPEAQPNLEPAQLVEDSQTEATLAGNEHSVTSSTIAASSGSVEVSSENMTPFSSPTPSQNTLGNKSQEPKAAKKSLGSLNDAARSPAGQELPQRSRSSESEVMSSNRNNAPNYKHNPLLTGSANNLGLSRAAQRKRPLFSRVSNSHNMQPKKVRLSAAVGCRQDTNNSILDTDSKQGENERNLIELQRLTVEKERLALEKEKLSIKKERHALKKEKLSLEKQKLFLEIQRLKLELQQINGVKSSDDTIV